MQHHWQATLTACLLMGKYKMSAGKINLRGLWGSVSIQLTPGLEGRGNGPILQTVLTHSGAKSDSLSGSHINLESYNRNWTCGLEDGSWTALPTPLPLPTLPLKRTGMVGQYFAALHTLLGGDIRMRFERPVGGPQRWHRGWLEVWAELAALVIEATPECTPSSR